MKIRDVLKEMVRKDASDLHMKVGARPIFRINRQLVQQDKFDAISSDEMDKIISEITNENQWRQYNENNEIDYAYICENVGRFRVNVFRQRGESGIVMRRIKEEIPGFNELNLPEVFEEIASHDRGIILVTGASSSGKSTTLAAIIDYINSTANRHIMTLENPIEFLHKDKKSVINQREIGIDTESFHAALRHVIRQDPDVIVIGEMRDKESVVVSVSAAETGHLVLSSFHADDAVQAITRLLDFFPSEDRNQVRAQLASSLRAITSQRLLKRSDVDKDSDSPQLIPAVEVMMMNPVTSKLIRDNKLKDLHKAMTLGEDGMCTYNMALASLFRNDRVSKEEALSKSSNPEALKINLKGIYLDEDRGLIG